MKLKHKVHLHTYCNDKMLSILLQTKVMLQPAITCSKLTLETLEQGEKYVQS